MTDRTAQGETAQAAAPAAPAPAIADGVDRRLDPRYVDLQQVVGLIATGGIGAATIVQAIVLLPVRGVPWWVPALTISIGTALTVAAAAFVRWWPRVDHDHRAYRLGARGIEIRHGVWWRAAVNVPISRIQHTDVAQGPIERRYGLATLIIHTAGTDHAKVDLPGLDYATALAIRDHLVAGGGDDAV